MSATNEQCQALPLLHKQVKYPDRSFFSLGDPQVVNISTNLIYLLPKTWPIFVSRTHPHRQLLAISRLFSNLHYLL